MTATGWEKIPLVKREVAASIPPQAAEELFKVPLEISEKHTYGHPCDGHRKICLPPHLATKPVILHEFGHVLCRRAARGEAPHPPGWTKTYEDVTGQPYLGEGNSPLGEGCAEAVKRKLENLSLEGFPFCLPCVLADPGMFQAEIEVCHPLQTHCEKIMAWVDTGSTLTRLPVAIIQRLGLPQLPGHPLERVLGAAGWERHPVYNAWVSLDGIAGPDMVQPWPLTEAVIGATTLETHGLKVNPVAHKVERVSAMSLSTPPPTLESPSLASIPIEAAPFKSSAPMLKWQYREIVAELREIQRHSSDPTCPCTLADSGEFCLPKHALGVYTLAKETGAMDSAHTKILTDLADEALDYHEALKDRIVCGKPHKGEGDVVAWAWQWRKKIEPLYYACTPKGKVKEGHPAPTCTKPQIGAVTIPFTVASLDRRKERAVIGIIDTGATLSMIPKEIADDLGLEFLRAQDVERVGPSGVEKTTYEVRAALFLVEGKAVITEVWIGPRVLLGLTTLESLRMKVNPITERLEPYLGEGNPGHPLMAIKEAAMTASIPKSFPVPFVPLDGNPQRIWGSIPKATMITDILTAKMCLGMEKVEAVDEELKRLVRLKVPELESEWRKARQDQHLVKRTITEIVHQRLGVKYIGNPIALSPCERRHRLGPKLERCARAIKARPKAEQPRNPYAVCRAAVTKKVCP